MAHTALAELALVYGSAQKARHEFRLAPGAIGRAPLALLAGDTCRSPADRTPHNPSGRCPGRRRIAGGRAGLGEQTDAPSLLFYQPLIAQRSEQAKQSLTHRQWQRAWQDGYTWTQAQALTAGDRWLGLDGA